MTIAPLLQAAKLNGLEPFGYLTDALTRIVSGYPNSQIDELLPWSTGAPQSSRPWPENTAYVQRRRPRRAIFERMGKRIVHCGEGGRPGSQICNNVILGITMAGVGEAFVLGEKLGLSHQALIDVTSTSSGRCWSITSYRPVPVLVPTSLANNDYKPGFAAALMLRT